MTEADEGFSVLNSLDGLEGKHLGEVVDQSFIGMTSWFKTRNQSKHMYKVHRHIDMKHVVKDIYKQNSSSTFHGQCAELKKLFLPLKNSSVLMDEFIFSSEWRKQKNISFKQRLSEMW